MRPFSLGKRFGLYFDAASFNKGQAVIMNIGVSMNLDGFIGLYGLGHSVHCKGTTLPIQKVIIDRYLSLFMCMTFYRHAPGIPRFIDFVPFLRRFP